MQQEPKQVHVKQAQIRQMEGGIHVFLSVGNASKERIYTSIEEVVSDLKLFLESEVQVVPAPQDGVQDISNQQPSVKLG